MKNYLVKAIAMTLTVFLLIAAASACGKSNSDDEVVETKIVEGEVEGTGETNSSTKQEASGGSSGTPAKVSDPSISNVPSNLKGTTIRYFYWWDPKQQMEKEAIAAFEKKTGIKVVTEVGNYSTFTTELAAKIAAGNSPDIVRLLSNAMYQVKCLQPVTNSGYDFSDDFWWKKLMKDYTYDGKCYAVNATPKNAAILDTYMIYYNKRALKQAEIEDPYQLWKKDHSKWTWSKLWSMCEEFCAANNNKSGYYGISFQYNNAYVRMFGCSNYDYDSSKGKWVNNMKSAELEKRWKELLTYNSKKLSAINHDAQSFQRAKILFDGAGPFAARTRDQTHKSLKDRKELGVVPIPSDSPYQLLYEYTAFGIPQGAKNAAAVPYYLRYVLDKKNYDLNKVYYDVQAKDVVEYTLSYPDNKYFFGENEIYDMRQALVNGTPDQVKSTLASYYGRIQDAVDSSNDQIKYLSK